MDLIVKQALELYRHLDNAIDDYMYEHETYAAVPILAGLKIIDKYAEQSGSSLEEVLESELNGIKKEGKLTNGSD